MPSLPPRTGRLQWTDVPDTLRTGLGDLLGAPVTDAATPAGGFGHQFAAVLTLCDGRRVFAKAASSGDPLTAANLHEAAILRVLPADAPAPALLAVQEAGGWTAVVMEHLDGPHPDLSPTGVDHAHVTALLDKLTSRPAPAPYAAAVRDGGPPGAARLQGWAVLAADPPRDLPTGVHAMLPRLVELEAAWPLLARGDRIVHGDLRADNMVRDHLRGPVFVDWAHAGTGPACVDIVSLAPQLVLAGHEPRHVARLLHEHPAAAEDPRAAAAFLAALTGHWHRNALLPAPAGVPGLRAYQRRAAEAGLTILALV